MSWQRTIGDKAQQSNLEPYTLAGAVDFADVPTSGQDGYAIIWDNTAGKFVLGKAGVSDHGALSGLADDDHTQYLLASGSRAGAVSGLQAFTSGVVTGIVRPAVDSTTAFRVQNAAGSADILGVDSSVNIVYATRLRIYNDDGQIILYKADKTTTLFSFRHDGSNAQLTSQIGHLFLFAPTAKRIELGIAGAGKFRASTNGVSLGTAVDATALADVAASTTALASLRIRTGTAPTSPNDGDVWNNGNSFALRVNGTNAVNTDGGLSVWMQSSTTARNVGRLLWRYTDKTDATRVTEGAVTSYYQGTEHKAVRWRGGSGGPLLSFYDVATPIARQVLATGAGASVDDVITALQNLGLVKQS